MTLREVVNIKYNLDGDVENVPSEEEMARHGAAKDKKSIFGFNSMSRFTYFARLFI